MKRFENKVTIVTGASNGIGPGIANEASGDRAVAEITAAGGQAVSVSTDMAGEARVEAMVEATLA
jgi:3-oxoacyl-[acyl-carrier protein] reductase